MSASISSDDDNKSPLDKEEGKVQQEAKITGNENHIDIMSPYYLHASDHPGQVFVSEPLHDGNYGEWVVDMSNALCAKNKMGFVDGTISMPNANSWDLAHWMRCNAMVKGWLKSNMDKEVRTNVRYANTAREIWIDLEERFAKESAPRVYELKRAITLLKQEKLSVPTYFTKLKGLWDKAQSIARWPKYTCGACECDLQKRLTKMLRKRAIV